MSKLILKTMIIITLYGMTRDCMTNTNSLHALFLINIIKYTKTRNFLRVYHYLTIYDLLSKKQTLI